MRSAEDAVRGSALEWTVLRPSNFDQNFDEDLFHAPLVAGELALPAGAVPEPFIDVEDVADVAAAVLTEPGRHAGRIYELTGPRVDHLRRGRRADLPGVRAAHHLQAGLRPPSTPRRWSSRAWARTTPTTSPRCSCSWSAGLIAGTTDDVATVLGRAPRTFEDYVAADRRDGGVGAMSDRRTLTADGPRVPRPPPATGS